MGRIELILTHFRKFWFIRIPVKIKVGFLFWNEAILLVAREMKIELKDFFSWAEKNQTLYFTEMLYASYLVWCKENFVKPKLSKRELVYSFSTLPESKQKELMKVWSESESFGVKEEKKKVKK
jgi:hypothetical protein